MADVTTDAPEWGYQPGGRNLPIDRGMAVRHQPLNAGQVGASARLYLPSRGGKPAEALSLWIYEVEAGFSMGGTRAQSQGHRDFYAHNFTQPKFTVRGQTGNNFEFNRLAEFIRRSHLHAIHFNDDAGLDARAMTLVILAKGTDTRRNHKGSHKRHQLEGFVPSFRRGAKRFEFAVDYEFEFIVTRSVSGLATDERYKARRLQSWAEIVTKPDDKSFATRGKTDFVTDPDDSGVSRIMRYADDNDYSLESGVGVIGYRGPH